ncbi:MAG: two-component system sensor histidine kinase PfeS [Paraglaciecola psychrophila]|jgi:two-component system sensor histidine kinase PfeS
MSRRLFWKLCLIITVGTITLFYAINVLTNRAETGMSFISTEHREQILLWGGEAERLYIAGDEDALGLWLEQLQTVENTWAAVIESNLRGVGGSKLTERFYRGFTLGRYVDWKIHLYFEDNPLIEVPFADRHSHFVILLPARMRPGLYWGYTSVALQIILPMILLAMLSIVLYRHIMQPLRQLQRATGEFTRGNLEVRVGQLLGSRSDEMTELVGTFDLMAERIGELIISQRQLISDLSHELRTPLTRLDMAIAAMNHDSGNSVAIERVNNESKQIRKLVDDTLTLAWLNNERPQLQQEPLDLVDLLDVLIEDARFEFPDRCIHTQLPDCAPLQNSNHRALGQALENIIRNGLRYTPAGKSVFVSLDRTADLFSIVIRDEGPGVDIENLETIFQPFFREDSSRLVNSSGFGLGLALARRQIEAIGGSVSANNRAAGGLQMTVILTR